MEKRLKNAEESFKRAKKNEKERAWEKAIDDYNKAIKLKPDYHEAYNSRGSLYQAMGKHDEALKDYNWAIWLKPDYFMSYNNRGSLYDDMKQHQKALEDYNMAIQRNPNYHMAYNNRPRL